MRDLIKQILNVFRKKSILYKMAFRSKDCTCVFKVKNFADSLHVNIKMIKVCENHQSLLKEKTIEMRIAMLEQGIESGDFILDPVGYMTMNKKDKK